MDTNAKILTVPAVTAVAATSSSTPSGDFRRGRDAQKAEALARYRLVIEEGPAAGSFVYKTLDSATGEVIRQFPREEVLRMTQSGDYSAGGLIETSA